MGWPCSGNWGTKLSKILATLQALQTSENHQAQQTKVALEKAEADVKLQTAKHMATAAKKTNAILEKAAKPGQGKAKTEEVGAVA
eukprot:15468127-Heterocapsa_arctica.AAC.1